MSGFWSKFKKNRFALLNYFWGHTTVLLGALFLILHYHLGTRATIPASWLVAVIPLSIFVGLKITTWMHNCMHFNYEWGNTLFGEITSFYALMSFGIICNLHVLHHCYPDTEMDPHNPEGLSFLNLFFTSQFRGVRIIENKFYEFHGRTLPNILIFKSNIFLHFLGNALRLAIWYEVMGPLFYCAYLPGLLAYLFVFNHLNFATHKINEAGEAVVLNINSNLYYKTTNWICEGIYFHLNHHLYPRRTNPSRPARWEAQRKPALVPVTLENNGWPHSGTGSR